MKCCFCGHGKIWDLPYNINLYITKSIEFLIKEHDVNIFLSGGMGSFDKEAEAVVRKLKKTYPHIKLFLYLPYLTESLNKRKDYIYTLYDEIIYPELEDVYFKAAIQKRNRIMVDESDYMVSYVKNKYGGAWKTYNYAKKKNDIKIINIAERISNDI